MARQTLASTNARIDSLESKMDQILALLTQPAATVNTAAPAKPAPAPKVESEAWTTIKTAKAARAAKDVRCALNSTQRKALAAQHRDALTAARKVSQAQYDALWLSLVTAFVAAK